MKRVEAFGSSGHVAIKNLKLWLDLGCKDLYV
jgi:hypothetical protein